MPVGSQTLEGFPHGNPALPSSEEKEAGWRLWTVRQQSTGLEPDEPRRVQGSLRATRGLVSRSPSGHGNPARPGRNILSP